MTTEFAVYQALADRLAPLLAYGFTVVRHSDDVAVTWRGRCAFIPARELIEEADGDLCAYVVERML